METTYRESDRYGFLSFLWTVFATIALALLVMWICGGYMASVPGRPAFMMPLVGLFVLDASTRALYGLSLYLTMRADHSPARQASLTMWTITFVMSLALIPVLFVLGWTVFAFVWMIAMIGVTTAQFLVNFKVSIAAALTVLPYWALLIYGACILFAIL